MGHSSQRAPRTGTWKSGVWTSGTATSLSLRTMTGRCSLSKDLPLSHLWVSFFVSICHLGFSDSHTFKLLKYKRHSKSSSAKGIYECKTLFSNVEFDDIWVLPSLCSVMYLKFVPKSHLFFTAGKDRKIKQWDADRFEHVQTLEVASPALLLVLAVALAEGASASRWRERVPVCESRALLRVWGLLFLLPGPPPGSVVLGRKPQWRLCRVVIPWQISETLGEDAGASDPWGREGDGKDVSLGYRCAGGCLATVPAGFLFTAVTPQYKFKDSRKRIPRLLSPFQQPGRDGCH